MTTGKCWATSVIALLVAMVGAACTSTQATADPVQPADTTSHVLYEVEGTTDYADVTMASEDGGTVQISPDVPMTRKSGERGLEFTAPAGAFLYISAQNNRSHGTISCRITVDGEVISENESSGGYSIATCEGTA